MTVIIFQKNEATSPPASINKMLTVILTAAILSKPMQSKPCSPSPCSRTEWFKEFVRTLDKKAPYEDRKDLALNALRTRYGPEFSLLASEDRLLGGVSQHRAGKFPWGTSRKDREESHKREREHGHNATPSGHNALPSGHI